MFQEGKGKGKDKPDIFLKGLTCRNPSFVFDNNTLRAWRSPLSNPWLSKPFRTNSLLNTPPAICVTRTFFFRFVCISDTHGLTGGLKLPPGDVLIHAGDFSNVGAPKDIAGFVDFLNAQNFKHKVSK